MAMEGAMPTPATETGNQPSWLQRLLALDRKKVMEGGARLGRALIENATGVAAWKARGEAKEMSNFMQEHERLAFNLVERRAKMLEVAKKLRAENGEWGEGETARVESNERVEMLQTLSQLRSVIESLPKEQAAEQRKVLAKILWANRTRHAEAREGIQKSISQENWKQRLNVAEKATTPVIIALGLATGGLGAGAATIARAAVDTLKRTNEVLAERHRQHARDEADRIKVRANTVFVQGLQGWFEAVRSGDIQAMTKGLGYAIGTAFMADSVAFDKAGQQALVDAGKQAASATWSGAMDFVAPSAAAADAWPTAETGTADLSAVETNGGAAVTVASEAVQAETVPDGTVKAADLVKVLGITTAAEVEAPESAAEVAQGVEAQSPRQQLAELFTQVVNSRGSEDLTEELQPQLRSLFGEADLQVFAEGGADSINFLAAENVNTQTVKSLISDLQIDLQADAKVNMTVSENPDGFAFMIERADGVALDQNSELLTKLTPEGRPLSEYTIASVSIDKDGGVESMLLYSDQGTSLQVRLDQLTDSATTGDESLSNTESVTSQPSVTIEGYEGMSEKEKSVAVWKKIYELAGTDNQGIVAVDALLGGPDSEIFPDESLINGLIDNGDLDEQYRTGLVELIGDNYGRALDQSEYAGIEAALRLQNIPDNLRLFGHSLVKFGLDAGEVSANIGNIEAIVATPLGTNGEIQGFDASVLSPEMQKWFTTVVKPVVEDLKIVNPSLLQDLGAANGFTLEQYVNKRPETLGLPGELAGLVAADAEKVLEIPVSKNPSGTVSVDEVAEILNNGGITPADGAVETAAGGEAAIETAAESTISKTELLDGLSGGVSPEVAKELFAKFGIEANEVFVSEDGFISIDNRNGGAGEYSFSADRTFDMAKMAELMSDEGANVLKDAQGVDFIDFKLVNGELVPQSVTGKISGLQDSVFPGMYELEFSYATFTEEGKLSLGETDSGFSLSSIHPMLSPVIGGSTLSVTEAGLVIESQGDFNEMVIKTEFGHMGIMSNLITVTPEGDVVAYATDENGFHKASLPENIRSIGGPIHGVRVDAAGNFSLVDTTTETNNGGAARVAVTAEASSTTAVNQLEGISVADGMQAKATELIESGYAGFDRIIGEPNNFTISYDEVKILPVLDEFGIESGAIEQISFAGDRPSAVYGIDLQIDPNLIPSTVDANMLRGGNVNITGIQFAPDGSLAKVTASIDGARFDNILVENSPAVQRAVGFDGESQAAPQAAEAPDSRPIRTEDASVQTSVETESAAATTAAAPEPEALKLTIDKNPEELKFTMPKDCNFTEAVDVVLKKLAETDSPAWADVPREIRQTAIESFRNTPELLGTNNIDLVQEGKEYDLGPIFNKISELQFAAEDSSVAPAAAAEVTPVINDAEIAPVARSGDDVTKLFQRYIDANMPGVTEAQRDAAIAAVGANTEAMQAMNASITNINIIPQEAINLTPLVEALENSPAATTESTYASENASATEAATQTTAEASISGIIERIRDGYEANLTQFMPDPNATGRELLYRLPDNTTDTLSIERWFTMITERDMALASFANSDPNLTTEKLAGIEVVGMSDDGVELVGTKMDALPDEVRNGIEAMLVDLKADTDSGFVKTDGTMNLGMYLENKSVQGKLDLGYDTATRKMTYTK